MTLIRLPPIPTIRDIIKIYRISAIKELSQNFLMQDKLTDKIVKCMGKIHNFQILEVGPGPGAITRSILKKFPKKLVLIEKDTRFQPTLQMLKDACNTSSKMDLIFDDIMNIDMKTVFDPEDAREWNDECPNIHLIGNLPFSISTALIIRWLHDISEKRGAWSNGRVQMTLTFQKEVAERLVAKANENQRCRLSVMAQAWTTPTLRFIIPGSSFVPKPDVDVGVVTFTPLKKPRTKHDFILFEKVIRHLFSFRQKYSIKSAGTLFPPDCREFLSSVMYNLAGVDPKKQIFTLPIEDINRLVSAYQYLCEKHPEIVNYNYRASKRILSNKLMKSFSIQSLESNSKQIV